MQSVRYAGATCVLLGLAAVTLGSACNRNEALAPVSTNNPEQIQRLCLEAIAQGYVLAPASDVGVRRSRPAPGPRPQVVIYGASWCRACGATAKYLARRGVPYVERDVDQDATAHDELVAALADAGLPATSSLPVVDVRGTVMTGFYPCVFEQAWASAGAPTTH